jgi:hypothetical protein
MQNDIIIQVSVNMFKIWTRQNFLIFDLLIYFNIDPQKYLTLAKNHGTQADIDFFDVYANSFPVGNELYWIDICRWDEKNYLDTKIKLWENYIRSSKSEFYKNLAKSYITSFKATTKLQECTTGE